MGHQRVNILNNSSLLRPRSEGGGRVTNFELFFDLVYVFAVTQLSHLLLEHLSIHGALQTALLLLVVWTAWIYTAWATNWLDPNQRSVRIMLIGVMLASLFMSAMLPEAFGEHGVAFAAAYVVMQAGRALFIVLVTENSSPLHQNFVRIVIWQLAAGIFWITGGFAAGSTRELFWVAAAAIDFIGPIAYFAVPRLGHSTTRDWSIDGHHIAERCQLFMIVALGESIVVMGATFSSKELTASVFTAFVIAFLGSVAFWWIYFDRTAGLSAEIIASSNDPGRLGRSAFTYYHIPMVAGVIVAAVGDELTIAHPTGEATTALIATVLGGPALFLAGHALFKWSMFGHISYPRLLALAAFAALLPISLIAPPLVVSGGAMLVLVTVVWSDFRVAGRLSNEEILEIARSNYEPAGDLEMEPVIASTDSS
jgi:low temperature requirement protein LtrA